LDSNADEGLRVWPVWGFGANIGIGTIDCLAGGSAVDDPEVRVEAVDKRGAFGAGVEHCEIRSDRKGFSIGGKRTDVTDEGKGEKEDQHGTDHSG
jgi:hypothetical protein